METIQCIETRRSVRKYQDKEIPNEARICSPGNF